MKAEKRSWYRPTWTELELLDFLLLLPEEELLAEELVEEPDLLEPDLEELEPVADALEVPVEPPEKVTESVAELVPTLPISFKAEAQPAWVVPLLNVAEPLKSQLDLEPPWAL